MLASVLLHVVPSPGHINQSMNSAAGLGLRRIFQEVQNGPVVAFRYLGNPQLFYLSSRSDPPCVKHLSPAGGIKRRAIQNERWTRINHGNLAPFRIELVQKRIVIIKMFGHGRMLSVTADCSSIRPNDPADLPGG